MAARKSWAEKRDGAPAPHVNLLAKAFMGAPAGGRLFIASPRLVQAYMDAIPCGQTRTVPQMREEFARNAGAHVTCPTSTGLFVRIVAEAALDDLRAGAPEAKVTPFWRLVAPESDAAKKLSCGPAFVKRMRVAEAQGN